MIVNITGDENGLILIFTVFGFRPVLPFLGALGGVAFLGFRWRFGGWGVL